MTPAKILLSTLWVFIYVGSSKGNGRVIQIEVNSEEIPVASTFMSSHFQDLTENLSTDRKDATCASSDFTSERTFDIVLQNPSRIYALSLLMHKYVDVNVEVLVSNKTRENTTFCTTVAKNTGIDPYVFLNCQREIYGEIISIEDLRNNPEFFVVCEVRVFGAPKPPGTQQSSTGLLPVYIGCGALALLIVVVTVVILCLRRSRNRTSHHSEAHSLSALSMMTGQPPMSGGDAVNRAHSMGRREPVSVPRPTTVISRSLPNTYARPMSGKDPMPIYETLPGEESPYLPMGGGKTLYDDASSFQMGSKN